MRSIRTAIPRRRSMALMLAYKHGTANLGLEHGCCCPSIRWLGLRAAHVRRADEDDGVGIGDGDDDDEIYMAQQLANQPAAATGARRKKPTAAQRRAQDAKWDSIA